MTEASVQAVKCACPDCVCVVRIDGAIERDGRLYCADSCAEGHADGSGCGHAGCRCHG